VLVVMTREVIMDRRSVLGVLALAGTRWSGAAAAQPPNVVFVLADDLGYGDIGCYGQKQIETPNIDRLAREGIRFTQAYAGATVCAPSRCCLMTGMAPTHARMRSNAAGPILSTDLTVAEVFRNAGYRTALYGKWSLGELGTSGYPTRKGFDEWFGFFSQTHAHNYYPDVLLDGDGAKVLAKNLGTKPVLYATDLFTERALRFIDAAGNQPFFLHLCYTTPHANNQAGHDTGNGMQVPSDSIYHSKNWPQPEKNFAAMITGMDSAIGQLMASLARKGMDRNTLVIFASDNGPHKEGGHDANYFHSSGPLRGIKRDLYEGGIRVPFVARWPQRIQAGSTSGAVIAFWDFLATAADLTGQPRPARTDGVSFVPALTGGRQPEHAPLYWVFGEGGLKEAVRMGDWKGVRIGEDGPVELYDLGADIGEQNDVAAMHPDVVKKIDGLMKTNRPPLDQVLAGRR